MFVGVPSSARCRVWPSACRAWCAAPRSPSSVTEACALAQIDGARRSSCRRWLRGDAALLTSPVCASATSCAEFADVSRHFSAPAAPRSRRRLAGHATSRWPRRFKLIAANGPDCFYRMMPEKGCDIAQGIVEGQKILQRARRPDKGGSMTLADLEDYQPAVREPIEGTYRGYLIKAMGPPSSGALTRDPGAQAARAVPDRRREPGLRLRHDQDAQRHGRGDARGLCRSFDLDGRCSTSSPVPTKGLLAPGYIGLRGDLIVHGVRLSHGLPAGRPACRSRRHQADDGARVHAAADRSRERNDALLGGRQGGQRRVVHEHDRVRHGIGVFAGYTRGDGSFRNHGFLLNNELTDFNTRRAPTPSPANPATTTCSPTSVRAAA